MPQDDPFAAYGGSAISSPTQANSSPTNIPPPQSDPFAAFGGTALSSESPSSPQPTQAPQDSSDPFAAFGGQSVQKTDNEPDPNEGLLAKSWRLANQPLTESLFGIPESRPGAGGLERGAEKVLSGFTSPLSLLLTVGTLGTAGFLESAGANVLKSTLMAGAEGLDAAGAAEKVAQFGKAAEAATKAFKTTGQSVSGAVEATGMKYNEFRSLQNLLYDSGLKEADVTGGNLVTRGVSSVFRNLGMDAVKAQKLAKGTQFLMDTGFTGQQIHQAVQTVPKVFDLLKEGRYDDAAEYMVEGGVGGTLGLLGVSHAMHSAGELAGGSINERERLRPSGENQKLNEAFGQREGAHQAANLTSQNWENATREEMDQKLGFSKVFESKADRDIADASARKLLVAMDTGNDPELARQTGNALADAIDQPERKLGGPEDFKPGEFADAEQQVLGLKIDKPLEDISPNDIIKTGGSQDLADKWSNYSDKAAVLYTKDKSGNYSVDPSGLSKEAAFKTFPATENHPPSVVLNPFASEIINRALEKTDGVRPDSWLGTNINRRELNQITLEIQKQADSLPKEQRQGYDWAISSLRQMGNNPGDSFVLMQDRSNVQNTYNHEATHTWLDQNKLPDKVVNGFVNSPDPVVHKAVKFLLNLGYHPGELFEEIGTHLSEGGEDLKEYGDLSKAEIKDLAKKYFSLYNKDALKSLPSEHSNVQQALKDIGHANINQGAGRSVPQGTTRGLAPFQKSQHPGLPENLVELVHNAKLNDKQRTYVSKFINAYHDVAKGLTDKEQEIYQKLRDRDDQNWNEASTNGLIHDKIENHIHHVWGEDSDIGNRLIQQARTGMFDTNVTQARKRVWDTYAEGLLRGRQLVTDDPVAIIGHDLGSIQKAAANRQLIDFLRDHNVRGSDGRPLTVLSGEGHVVQNADGSDPSLMINPNRVRNIHIADHLIDQMRQSGELDRFLQRGDIVSTTSSIRPDNIDQFINKFENKATGQTPQYDAEGNDVLRKDIQTLKNVKNGTAPASALGDLNAKYVKSTYAWHPQDYVTPRDKSLSGWNWLAKTDDGTNVISRSDIKFHPEIADYMINRLGLEKSYLKENKGIGKITGPILKGGGAAKKVLLSFSPFHLQQEALRAVMMGVNPLKIHPIGELNARPDLKTTVENGLTIAPDRNAIQEHSAGVASHSAILSKIPVIGKALDWYQDFLFNRYIPSMKAQAAEMMFDKYQKAHPDWTRDAVGKATAEHVNNAFGGQNWRAMGRATATQDWFHLLALAPDWVESEARAAASMMRGGLGGRNFTREQAAKMAFGLWGVARVANLVNTGDMHLEAPFGFAVKDKDGKENIYSVRTLPTDVLHMASDPVGFLKGRMSPFARIAEEVATGRDNFGRKLQPGDLAVDIGRNMVPLPFQALGQIASGDTSSVGNVGQVLKASGITVTPYRTEAEKLASNIASEKSESGLPLNPEKLRRSQAISKFEDDIRAGNLTLAQLNDAKDFGPLTESEHKKILTNIKLTAGMDPQTARMVSHVSRLDMPSALQVWDAATPSEKSALAKTLIKKKNNYMAKAYKEMTPEERLSDPTFRRVRLLWQQNEQP